MTIAFIYVAESYSCHATYKYIIQTFISKREEADHSLATGVCEVGGIGIALLPAGGVCCSLCHVTHKTPVEVQVHFDL